jgi:hypothetical protein
MSKRALVLVLGSLIILGLSGTWFLARQRHDQAAIAGLPPAQALGFVAIPGLPQAWEDLRRSQYFRHVSSSAFWQRALGEERYGQLVQAIDEAERQLGFTLTEQNVGRLLGRELGVALVPGRGGLWPVDVIAYVRLSSPEKLAESLSRAFAPARQDLSRETQTVAGGEIVTLRPKAGLTQVSYTFLDDLAVVSTDPAWVIDAIHTHRRPGPDRLRDSAVFRAMPFAAVDALLAYGYYDGAALQALALSRPPARPPTPAAAALSRLQTSGKVSLKALRADGGIKLETLALYPPNGIADAFRQVERAPAIPPFAGVPAETFYLNHVDLIDLQALWPLVRHFFSLTSPALLAENLTQFRLWTGADFERDVLPLLTGVGSLGITAPLGAPPGSPLALPGLFVALGLTDGPRGQQLMRAIVAHAGGPMVSEFLQPLPHAGHTIFYLNHPFLPLKPAYVVSRQQLIVGSDVRLLQHMLDAASGKTPTLSEVGAYRDLRRQFRITGGSIAFIDVPTAVEKAQEALLRVGFVLRTLTSMGPGVPALGLMPGDPQVLLELLRPLRYIGAVSQAESQGVRTESFIAFEDLK